MTFKPRPYDPDRFDDRSQAQRDATVRNFGIFKLRGLHAQMGMLTGPRRELAQMLVDQELIARGAMTMREAQQARIAKALRQSKNSESARKCFDCGEPWLECDCIPF